MTAVTGRTFYKLHRDELEVAMVTERVRKALEEENQKRSKMRFAE